MEHPQGRGKIERFFRTLNDTLFATIPVYSQNGKPLSKPKLTFTQLNAAVKDFIVTTYNQQINRTIVVSPLQRWSESFLPQMADSVEELDLLLLYIQKPRKVPRDGIRFHGMRYISSFGSVMSSLLVLVIEINRYICLILPEP